MRESGYAKHPEYNVHWEPCPKRVRAFLGGQAVVDSTRAVLLYETRHTPVYYFPREDVNSTLLTPTAHSTFCPFKGDANYWSVTVDGKTVENAVWSYPEPFSEVSGLEDFVSVYWGKMDAWYEEDEEIFVHPRDPYVRLDVLASERQVEVILRAEVVASSSRALFVFETGLPTRYYFPPEDVRSELLIPSPTSTACPYKGTAAYWSATINGVDVPDIAWTYTRPVAEAAKLAGYIAFFDENVDATRVAGQIQSRPKTKWSTKEA
ncbi:MAG: DUF427 domain-containing protein [Gammaproteobacteria bacterium]|nr:DUF427 domain-containing protein [Gammaproteobacteria bacterium]